MVQYVEPTTLSEASELARELDVDAKFVSGGTAVVLMLQQRLIAPSVLIGLQAVQDVAGFRDIVTEGDSVRIGGGVTLEQVARSPVIRKLLPSLADSCAVVGNVRVRNAATLAGNVAEADYASDPPAVLTDLGATVDVRTGTGGRTVPVADVMTGFFSTSLESHEVVCAITVPVPQAGTAAAYLKYKSRSSEDRPCVGVAASARHVEGVTQSLSVVVGAVAPTVQRFPEVTATVIGQPLTSAASAEVAAAYASAIDPIDDARGSAWYRRRMVEVYVRRALAVVGGRSGQEDVA